MMSDWPIPPGAALAVPVLPDAVALIDPEDAELVLAHRWHLAGTGKHHYAQTQVRDECGVRSVRMHRLIIDAPASADVDHINHDTLDNRRCNLRLATTSQNMQNRSGARRDSRTGVRNVTFSSKKRYVVRIRLNRRHIHIGSFGTLAEAQVAAETARAQYMTHADVTRPVVPPPTTVIPVELRGAMPRADRARLANSLRTYRRGVGPGPAYVTRTCAACDREFQRKLKDVTTQERRYKHLACSRVCAGRISYAQRQSRQPPSATAVEEPGALIGQPWRAPVEAV